MFPLPLPFFFMAVYVLTIAKNCPKYVFIGVSQHVNSHEKEIKVLFKNRYVVSWSSPFLTTSITASPSFTSQVWLEVSISTTPSPGDGEISRVVSLNNIEMGVEVDVKKL